MAHHTVKSGYETLAERLNRSPQGAPPSKLLFGILKMLFSEREAELVTVLPIRPFSAKKAARLWKTDLPSARKTLDTLAGRAILLDIERDGESLYVLPPPMAGFFEFSLMRVRGDMNQKILAELFYRYINVEDDFARALFTHGETRLGRVFVQEAALTPSDLSHVLDYERATEVVRGARHIAVGTCYCRHKMFHVGKDCAAEKEICMTFNNSAGSLIKHGHARSVDKTECLDLLGKAREQNLVQFGDNVRKRVNFICNCCGCCCEGMIAARKYALLTPIATTNFIARLKTEACTGCGRCVEVCPVAALSLISANDPARPRKKKARLHAGLCLGCGVCVRNCGEKAVSLIPREKRVITPLNSAHRSVLMALERGKLQNLIFDNRLLWSHRALGAVLGAILNLPPVKRLAASRQLRSRYLEKILSNR